MEYVSCNINKTDKIHRITVGSILLLGALFDLGRGFMVVLATILLVEGFLGKCGIPYLIAKYEQFTRR